MAGGKAGGTTYNSQVSIDGGDALVGVGLEQLRGDDLLDGQDDAVAATDADRGAAIFDGLDGVLDLEVAAVGREDRVGQVVACAYRRLCPSCQLELCVASKRRKEATTSLPL